MRMAFVTTLMNALALTTLVEYATVQGRFTSVDARTFQQATAIAMAINLTPLVFVEALVQLTPMRMASVTMWTTALGPMTLAVFAMVQGRFMSVDVRTFQKATAIAMATNLTPSAFAEALVQLTTMQTASVTSLMNALAHTTLVECATVQENSTSVDARTFQQATAIAMATNSTPLVFAEALVQLMSMRMAFVTM